MSNFHFSLSFFEVELNLSVDPLKLLYFGVISISIGVWSGHASASNSFYPNFLSINILSSFPMFNLNLL